jgi:hypothetical protein
VGWESPSGSEADRPQSGLRSLSPRRAAGRATYACDDRRNLSLQKSVGLTKPILPIKRSMMYLAVLMGTTIVSSASI